MSVGFGECFREAQSQSEKAQEGRRACCTVDLVLVDINHTLLDAHIEELDEAKSARGARQSIAHHVHVLDLPPGHNAHQ